MINQINGHPLNIRITPIAIANHWSELDPATVKMEDVTSAPKGWDAIRQARELDGRDQE